MLPAVDHVWTRVPLFDEWGERRDWLRYAGQLQRYLKVERWACRCGAWRNVRFPMLGSRRAPTTTIIEACQSEVRAGWQDGAHCGPPAPETT